MKSFDIPRDGFWKARICYDNNKKEYIGPAKNIGLLLTDVKRHILLREGE